MDYILKTAPPVIDIDGVYVHETVETETWPDGTTVIRTWAQTPLGYRGMSVITPPRRVK